MDLCQRLPLALQVPPDVPDLLLQPGVTAVVQHLGGGAAALMSVSPVVWSDLSFSVHILGSSDSRDCRVGCCKLYGLVS